MLGDIQYSSTSTFLTFLSFLPLLSIQNLGKSSMRDTCLQKTPLREDTKWGNAEIRRGRSIQLFCLFFPKLGTAPRNKPRWAAQHWLWETEGFKQLECLIQKRGQIGLKPEKHFYLLLGINTFLPTGAGTKKFPALTNLACARGRSHGVRLQGDA